MPGPVGIGCKMKLVENEDSADQVLDNRLVRVP
jgi:hypothetical protein